MLNEITKKEFEERYPEVSTYGLEAYRPVQEPDEVDDDGEVLQWKTTGYEEEL
jgi:hypothetical protein